MLRAGGLVISQALLVMEFRSSTHWQQLRDRAKLAAGLRFHPFHLTSGAPR